MTWFEAMGFGVVLVGLALLADRWIVVRPRRRRSNVIELRPEWREPRAVPQWEKPDDDPGPKAA